MRFSAVSGAGGFTEGADGTVSRVLTLFTQDAPRPWDDIPGVVILGAVLGVLLLWAAIRAMFGKRDK